MAIVTGQEPLVRTGPGRLLFAPSGTTLPEEHDDPIDDAFVEVGFTTEGNEMTIEQSSEPIEVAERQIPIRYEQTSTEITYAFTMAQMSLRNLKFALNGGTITETPTSRKYVYPKGGGTDRHSIIWESEDGMERMILARCYSSGPVVIPRRKSPDYASIDVELTIEDNPDGDSWWTTQDPALDDVA